MVLLLNHLQFLSFNIENGVDFAIVSHELLLRVIFSLNELFNVFLPMPQLLKFFRLGDQDLNAFFV
jgi:hypothetical protein